MFALVSMYIQKKLNEWGVAWEKGKCSELIYNGSCKGKQNGMSQGKLRYSLFKMEKKVEKLQKKLDMFTWLKELN